MLCENCKINEATVHFTEIQNGAQTEHHVCSECAARLGVPGYTYGVSNANFPFVQMLTGLLAAGGLAAIQQDTPLQHICCPQCGMSFEEFTRVGKFGCAGCYDVFGPLIEDNMKCIHGDSIHCGKKYKVSKEDSSSTDKKNSVEKMYQSQLSDLELKLREAVEIEDFEEAARYRDEIKVLKEGNNKNA